MFVTRDDVLHWAHSIAYDIGFVKMIMRSDTYIGIKGRTSFVLIGCDMSEKYRVTKKDLV